MEAQNLGYSTKNIPIGTSKQYKIRLMEKIESLARRMRWKVFFAEHKADKEKMKETYGFKSNKTPPANEFLQPFEDDLFNIVNTVEFRIVNCTFQGKLKKDISKLKESNRILVSADKTTNFYSVSKDEYEKLMTDTITKLYKRAEEGTVEILNKEAKDIAQSLELEDRIQCMAEKHAFVTLKDHKENFASHPKCRLLNPAKSEIGSISKNILQKAMNEIKYAVNLNQWRSTAEVIGWFQSIRDKKSAKFIKFDIVDFYPSISKLLLVKCLRFARRHTNISDEEENIIMHACKSVLFDKNGAWIKRNSDELFDIGMGSYHGAEICELVGLFILSKLPAVFEADCFGLYRDDGLAVVKNLSDQCTDNIRKRLVELFKTENLDITVETNLKITDFLDITLNLNTEKFYPYRKPNDTPLYVNKKSNHPPSIIKQLPIMINKRLSDISYDKDEFDKSAPMYQKALEESGFQHRLEYIPPQTASRRNRQRKIIWFNPPYCKSVKTNIGRLFLKLLNKHFPSHHKFHKLFNRNTVKVSYSCLDNIDSKISQHNKKVLSPPKEEVKKTCSCPKKDKDNCPLQGRCLSSGIVYKATVTTETDVKHYIGLCETTFKQRLYLHRSAWNANNFKKSTGAELSKYMWGLLHPEVPYNIAWEVVANALPYKCSNTRCYLCLNEKLYIATHDRSSLLNKRTELVSKCRHKNKFTLLNFDRYKRKAPT